MKKVCVFILLSSPCLLFGMEKTITSAEGAQANREMPANVLEIHKQAIRKKLPAIRKGFLNDTLGSLELGISPMSFQSEAIGLVLAEELFGEELFAKEVVKWVNAYLINNAPSTQEKHMAQKLHTLIFYAINVGVDKCNVQVPFTEELRNARQQIWVRKSVEVRSKPRESTHFEVILDYSNKFADLFEKK